MPEVKGCTCDITTGCGEGAEAGCAACSKDVYAPCPVFGFMCGMPGDPPCDCCTPEQQEMTRRFYSPESEVSDA